MKDEIHADWQHNDNTLERTFKFKGYLKTMSFVNAVAWCANKLNHHPELVVNFNTCLVRTTTHDSGNIVTDKDYELAKEIDLLM
jgi:4a-hydroxytetrahydrobiopterin dehydratase